MTLFEDLVVGAAAAPWADAVPADDVGRFSGGASTITRPLEAGSSPALLVVDMTRAFACDDYPTGCANMAPAAVATARRLLARTRSAGHPVFYSKMYQEAGFQGTAIERGRWKPSVSAEADPSLPPGDVIVDELAPEPDDTVVYKGYKPSAFFGTPLASHLHGAGVDTLLVVGMSTSGCVRATVLDAFQQNLFVLLVHDGCADRSEVSHKVTLFDVHMKYADVVDADLAEAYLDALDAH
jgi:nicotinamidase-related amidase